MVLYFSNHYYTKVWISIQFYDPNCDGEQYRGTGWFEYEPGESVYVNVPELSDLRNVGQYYYFFIEAADGAAWTSDRFTTSVPNSFYDRCISVQTDGDRMLNFREIIIRDSADFNIVIIPNNLNPRITVTTGSPLSEYNGGLVSIRGDGFAPMSRVDLIVDNMGDIGPFPRSHAFTDTMGHFEVIDQLVPCDRFHCPGPATIRAIDSITGDSATGLTGAYCCLAP
jgi:hypothetical protein